MTNNAKPIGLQTNLEQTEQSFESFLTPDEQPENEIEEQATEELVNEEEIIEDDEPFEEELEAIEREEWLAKFDDRQVMNAARMFLEWLYHLPDDYEPNTYSEFSF